MAAREKRDEILGRKKCDLGLDDAKPARQRRTRGNQGVRSIVNPHQSATEAEHKHDPGKEHARQQNSRGAHSKSAPHLANSFNPSMVDSGYGDASASELVRNQMGWTWAHESSRQPRHHFAISVDTTSLTGSELSRFSFFSG